MWLQFLVVGEKWAAAPVKEKEKGNISLFGTYMEGINFQEPFLQPHLQIPLYNFWVITLCVYQTVTTA
jgi:hypothetical protein